METFKHHPYIVPKATVGKSGLVLSVGGEQCHQMDENKQGANSGRKRSILSIFDIVNRIIGKKKTLVVLANEVSYKKQEGPPVSSAISESCFCCFLLLIICFIHL